MQRHRWIWLSLKRAGGLTEVGGRHVEQRERGRGHVYKVGEPTIALGGLAATAAARIGVSNINIVRACSMLAARHEEEE